MFEYLVLLIKEQGVSDLFVMWLAKQTHGKSHEDKFGDV
jgi:hypothetical protein